MVEKQAEAVPSLVDGNRVPELGAAVDGGIDGGGVVPVEEVDVERGRGEEHLELGAVELGGGCEAGVESGDGVGIVALDCKGGGKLGVEVAGPEEAGGARGEGRLVKEVDGAEEDMLLRGDSANEVIAVGEEGVGAEFEGEGGGRGGAEEEKGALEVGLGVVEVVGTGEEDGGEAEAGTDLNKGEEGGAGLEDSLQALDGAAVVAAELGLLCQGPQPLHHGLHPHRRRFRLCFCAPDGIKYWQFRRCPP